MNGEALTFSHLSPLECRFLAALLWHPDRIHGLTLRRASEGLLCAFYWREPEQYLACVGCLAEPPKKPKALAFIHADLRRFAVAVAEVERREHGNAAGEYLLGLAIEHNGENRGVRKEYKKELGRVWDLPLMVIRGSSHRERSAD